MVNPWILLAIPLLPLLGALINGVRAFATPLEKKNRAITNLVALLEHKRECLQSIFIVSGFDLSFDASRIFLPKPLQFLSSCARNRIGWQGSATGCDP